MSNIEKARELLKVYDKKHQTKNIQKAVEKEEKEE